MHRQDDTHGESAPGEGARREGAAECVHSLAHPDEAPRPPPSDVVECLRSVPLSVISTVTWSANESALLDDGDDIIEELESASAPRPLLDVFNDEASCFFVATPHLATVERRSCSLELVGSGCGRPTRGGHPSPVQVHLTPATASRDKGVTTQLSRSGSAQQRTVNRLPRPNHRTPPTELVPW